MASYASAPATSFATLPRTVFESTIAPLLTISNLLAFSSVDRATRQLVLTPQLWRSKLFTSFPFGASTVPSLPSWCDVVQVMDTQRAFHQPASLSASFDSLVRFPNLRHLYASHYFVAASVPSSLLTSLAALRHLTRIELTSGGSLDGADMRLLATLPALASFTAKGLCFGGGSAETLAEWLAVCGKKQGLKRKAEDDAEEEDMEDAEGKEEVQDDEDEDEEEEKEEYNYNHDCDSAQEDPDDPSLPQRYSPLLLFLHALASKPSFVHLRLGACFLTSFVMDHMPVWPHLQCLPVWNDELTSYSFANVASRFPSLTSLTSSCCSTAAIRELVRLPRLVELRFPDYSVLNEEDNDGVRTTARGFRTFSQAPLLRSVQYISSQGGEEEVVPSLASLTALFTLTNLTRLTVGAHWLGERKCVQLFTQHRFDHLRCLELIAWYDCGFTRSPQTDVALLPLVKPDIVVAGREGRQAARAANRQRNDAEADMPKDEVEGHYVPADNAANFPALECLALPYLKYNSQDDTGRVSAWMKQQLRRSYEYEAAAEWEAEMSTLGEAELLKSMA